MIPPFSQGTKMRLLCPRISQRRGVSWISQRWMVYNSERGNNGNVGFNLRMVSSVRFKAKAWRTRRRFLKVLCGDLAVGIQSNGRSGTLIGGPRQCRVGI
ncbi:UNVERIFIED_CONTAM: hypothetical protein Sangu_0266700 [Sesamum angustifolium]|uniref:Uncharacterized protein n=1 Tax=Sesamum angustifolium TaxID=2727405 RepID=A0AAW2QNJ2_9LAMI